MAELPGSDGRQSVVSGSADGTVKVWITETGDVLTISRHAGPVRSVAVLPDGRVVSGSDDGTVKIWSSENDNVLTMSRHAGPVWSVAVLADGRVVSGSDDGTVKVWNPESDHVLTMSRYTGPVWSVAVLADGRVVSGSDDGTVKVWNPESDHVLTMSRHAGPVGSVAVLPDGRVVSGSHDGTVKVWNTQNNEVSTTGKYRNPVSGVSVLSDQRVLFWNKFPGLPRSTSIVRLLNVHTGDVLTMDEDVGPVACCTRLCDGVVASGNMDGTVKLWNPSSAHEIATSNRRTIAISMAMLPDGLVAVADRGEISVWHSLTGEVVKTISFEDPVVSVTSLPDGNVVVGGGVDFGYGVVCIWNPMSGQVVSKKTLRHRVTCVAVTSDGCIACGTGLNVYEGEVSVWDPRSTELRSVTDSPVSCVAGLADGRVAYGTQRMVKGALKIWCRYTNETNQIDGHASVVRAVARIECSDRAMLLVSGSDDGTVQILDANSGKVLTTIREHRMGVNVVGVLPDKLIVSGGADGTICILEIQSESAELQNNILRVRQKFRVGSSVQSIAVGRVFDKDSGIQLTVVMAGLADSRVVSCQLHCAPCQ